MNDAPNRVHQLMDSDRLDAATLGDKLAALDSKRFDRWQPIKSFLNDDTEIGLNRMVDAMSSFGVDGVTDWNAMSMNGIARNASEHLAANHDSRTPGRYLTEFRSVIE